MKERRSLRVVHLPTSVGGNPQGLSAHLRDLDVDSEVWELVSNSFGYQVDKTVWASSDGLIKRELKRLRAIWDAAHNFDIIHFNFGTTLAEPLPFYRDTDRGWVRKLKTIINGIYRRVVFSIELFLYRVHGCVMFIHYQGDDARQGDISLDRYEYSIAQKVGPGYYCRSTDLFKRRMIKVMAQQCAQVYAVNPDLLGVLLRDARFIPYCHITIDEWVPRFVDPDEAKPLRIGHAPSDRGVKGTDLFVSSLERLRGEGYAFDLDLIEGISQQEVLERIAKVDVVLDQLHAGWYGGVAVEAMALGKPVVVYIRGDDLRFIPDQMRADLPFIQATPDSVEVVLRRLLTMSRQELLELAVSSRAYVERWHNPATIAREILQDYRSAMSHRRHKRCAV